MEQISLKHCPKNKIQLVKSITITNQKKKDPWMQFVIPDIDTHMVHSRQYFFI